eukprot:gnl/Dysnectes_brevis/8464_a15047_290.p2 GENE.gnl/Dysnectes_brevis/8464_a15047_290~~gnl/Dysnectes_brevis/8464_a15047_290.p2  ORF type:complete len:126 (+),score=15.77 gnl/Dysnectes_brevis/8464_a15047_290:138-515(+)
MNSSRALNSSPAPRLLLGRGMLVSPASPQSCTVSPGRREKEAWASWRVRMPWSVTAATHAPIWGPALAGYGLEGVLGYYMKVRDTYWFGRPGLLVPSLGVPEHSNHLFGSRILWAEQGAIPFGPC